MKNSILIGNTFSLTLVRGPKVDVHTAALADLRSEVERGATVYSYWGHENTRLAAERVVGFSLRPKTERPALTLSAEGLPMLDGRSFAACWVLSPDYVPGYRPPVGTEVDEGKITGWQLLKLTWKTNPKGNC